MNNYIETLKGYSSIILENRIINDCRLSLYIFTCGYYIDLYIGKYKDNLYLRIERNKNRRDVTIFRWLGIEEDFKKFKRRYSLKKDIDALFKEILKIIDLNCPIEKYGFR